MSANAFQFEIAKETSRANRRATNREFAIVIISSENDLSGDLIAEFRTRLRISDSVGWYEERLAILLPETNRDGAMALANELAKKALLFDIRMDTDILVYPWDDDLAQNANELAEGEGGQPIPEDTLDPTIESEEAEENSATYSKSDFSNSLSPAERTSYSAFEQPLPTPIWKRAIDIVGAGAGLVVLSPVFGAAAIAIKMNSPGPVFFKQLREGINGKHFHIWKFRTMRNDAEHLKDELRSQSEQDGPAFKLKNDPRVTKVGKYLRKSCVDELPQLINVLLGQMSLVGPRPLPVNESEACRSWQRHRLRVLPGLTCIWQIDGGRDTKFDEWMRMDMDYIKKRSFLFDVRLIVRTAFLALLHRGSV